MIEKILIFDMSNMVYRTYHTFDPKPTDLKNNRELRIKVVKKCLIDIFSLVKLFHVNDIIFCFDSGSFRKEISDSYKGNRSENEDIDLIRDSLYDLLSYKGYNAVRIDNLEADDCIALSCEKFESYEKIIISADEDVRQLIRPRTYVLFPLKAKRKIYCFEYSKPKATQLNPNIPVEIVYSNDILTTKLLKGCNSDKIDRIAPSGYRMTNILKISKEYSDYVYDTDSDEFVSYKTILKSNNLNISDEDLEKQLKLVCLKSTFMPDEYVKEFEKFKFKKLPLNSLKINSVVENTIYF